MTWIAAHAGPDLLLSRHTASSWAAAARWLRAVMALSNPPGIREALHELNAAEPDCEFLAASDQHFYQISPG